MSHVSRDYAIPHGFTGDWKGIYLQAKPPHTTRSGALFQITPDRWRMGLLGAGQDYPPTSEDAFLDFARSLRSPLLYDVISRAKPLSPIRGYQQTANIRRYYEQMRRTPGHFLAIGDSATTFNPIYGQGMTAAAQSALVLDRLLQAGSPGDVHDIGPRFHRAAAKANASAWMIATGEDLRYPTTEGGSRNLMTRLTHRYLERIFRGSLERQRSFLALIDVIQLVDGPPALLKPAILLPAMRYGGRPDRVAPPERSGMPASAVRLARMP